MNRNLRPRKTENQMTPFKQGIASLQMSPSPKQPMQTFPQFDRRTNRRRLFADITHEISNKESVREEDDFHSTHFPSEHFDLPALNDQGGNQGHFASHQSSDLLDSGSFADEDDELEFAETIHVETQRSKFSLFLVSRLIGFISVVIGFVYFYGPQSSQEVLPSGTDSVVPTSEIIYNETVSFPEVEIIQDAPVIATSAETDETVTEDPVELVDQPNDLPERVELLEKAIVGLSTERHTNVDDPQIQSVLEIKNLIKQVSNQIGYADYASADAGAFVVLNHTSSTCNRFSRRSWVSSFQDWLFQSPPRKKFEPVMALQEPSTPGNCWPMAGSQGVLTVRLLRPVNPTNFTLEHISRKQALQGNVSSAPKDFEVYALINNEIPILLGKYTYDTESVETRQLFPVENRWMGPIDVVQLKILSNYGRKEFTCIYRFRVHGIP